ncbi:MAG: ATP-binding protein [Weeksellaceae bacterium]|nr:ATP-binding protein [Bacteroidota bacterium]MCG2781911.1 ATP-binding protein [Weeksellaceae bacterium]
MQLRQSERKQAKIKMALQGSAGSGKTYSSLLLAKGLINGDFSKVAIIDTENGSADLYAHLGNYNVLTLKPPFSPQQYVDAIDVCEKAGIQVIIIDSISHCWDYLLDYHSSLAGNSFTNWAKIKPLEKLFMNKILNSSAHVIATMRTKQDYVLNQIDGKMVPEKVGLKSVQRDGLDYEFTLVFDVDIKHFAVSSKDRTGLFMGKPEFTISEKTGVEILNWCNTGNPKQVEKPTQERQINLSEKEVYEHIQMCNNIVELLSLYKLYPQYQTALRPDFEARRSILINSANPNNFSKNGRNTQ